MASFQILSHHHHLHPPVNKPIRFQKKVILSSIYFQPKRTPSTIKRNQFGKSSRVVVAASGSDPSGKRQFEIVYNPEERINRLADEVDKSAGLSRLSLFSPCKINVFLRITGKRDDGFHDLASLFHVISLGDTIKFSLSPTKTRDRLSTNVPGVPLDDSNLIIKALNLYRKKTGTDNFFWIHLDKKSLLVLGLVEEAVMLQLLYGQPINLVVVLLLKRSSKNGLVKLAQISPFFSHGAAYCTGRGEVVQDIPHSIHLDLPMVLIKPQEACPTAEVYKAAKSRIRLRLEQTSSVDPLTLLKKIDQNGISQDVCINDLEPPAFEVLPSLKKLKQRVLAASRGEYSAVFMSGRKCMTM
ncbi:4-diphosphocytidyl-2-C-methyl-D-erythritol kinase, chloroplastic [Iris pallida]|uniref:4-diphosphocytidyl-2-C-methyl-D-erythritol kinase, chloroplastic n=1 Tax=Iris pallida TaxID=29817 RepID=A0AAX6IGB2_IRIPA|nr:4-diphosphocytidyl-2-C-methyl-D-erythritol kinase, chloroplastic [Iris pallida]